MGSDERTKPTDGLADSFLKTLDRCEPEAMSRGLDIAEEAARAARRRESAKNVTEEGLPEPSVIDLEAFRAKVTAKTNKFNKFMDRSKKQRENANHSLKLAWLRSGQDAADLGGFRDTLRQEAKAIEAEEDSRIAESLEQASEDNDRAQVDECDEDKVDITVGG